MIDVDRRIVFSYTQEDFTYADALGHIERLGRDPRFRPEYRQIIDLRDVTDPQLSADQVRALARHNVFNPDSRRARWSRLPTFHTVSLGSSTRLES